MGEISTWEPAGISLKMLAGLFTEGMGRNTRWWAAVFGSPLQLVLRSVLPGSLSGPARPLLAQASSHPPLRARVSCSPRPCWGPRRALQRAAGRGAAGGVLRLLSHVWAAAPSRQPRTWCGRAGLREGCRVAVFLIRSGGKKPCSLGLLAKSRCLEQEPHAWQHAHGFILHPFAVAGASAGCHLPGAAGCSAWPAVAGGGWGEDGCCTGRGQAAMTTTFPSLGRAAVMAVLSQAWSAGSTSALG